MVTYRETLQGLSTDQRTVLRAFSRTLGREEHVLAREPHLLWQQMYNRLQWEGEEVDQVLEPELEKRSAPGAGPWIRTCTPYRESQTLVRTLTKHTENVTTCAISPNGRFLASAGQDTTIVLWDIYNREEHAILKGHSGFIYCCTFSPDGNTLATTSHDHTVRLWDVSDGKGKAVLRGHTRPVISCAFTPDGQTLVSGGDDQTIRLWNILNGQEKKVYDNPDYLRCCVFSPDGSTLALACGDNWIRLWDVHKGKKRKVLKGHTYDVYCCAFSPDGLILASAGQDQTVRLWNARTGKVMKTLTGHTDRVRSCVFSPDGHTLVSAGDDLTLRLWDVATGKELSMFSGHTQRINACFFSPDGLFLASASLDCKVRLWDVRGDEPESVFSGYSEGYKFCQLSPDGCTLASARRGIVHLFNTETNVDKAMDTGEINWIHSCSFSPDGRKMAIASLKYSVLLMDLKDEKPIPALAGHTEAVLDCAFSPDGRTLASGSRDKTSRLWDINTKKELAVLDHPDSVFGCTFSPDSRTLATAGWDHMVRLWDVGSGMEQMVLHGHKQHVSSCCFSPDGHILASRSMDSLHLWNTQSGVEMSVFRGERKAILPCGFTPDGCYLIFVSSEKTLHLWDVQKQAYVVSFSLPLLGSINSITYHPWRPRVICLDEGGNIYILDLVGIEYKSLIVTSRMVLGKGLMVRCLACDFDMPLSERQLGCEITCSNPDCGTRLRINPFHIDFNVEITKITEILPPIRTLGLTNDGQLVSGYDDGTIAILYPYQTSPDMVLNTYSGLISAIAVLSEQNLAVTASQNGKLLVWDLETNRLMEALDGHKAVTAITIAPGWRIGVGFEDGSLLVQEKAHNPTHLQGHEEQITAVTFLPNRQLASSGKDLRVRLWDPATGKMLESFSGLKASITLMDATGEGRRMACGCADGLMFIWDFDARTSQSIFQAQSKILSVAGKASSFLFGGVDGNVSVFDLANAKSLYQKQYPFPIHSGALSADGRRGALLDEQGRIFRFKQSA